MKFNLTTFSSTALVAVMALSLSAPVDAKKVRASGNKNVNHNTNVNRNVNRNTNVNVNQRHNTNVNVNVNNNRHYNNGCCYHNNYNPIGTVAAVAMTAVVVGSIVSSLPPDCTTVVVNGFSYRQCGNTWYQPQISGSSTTYVVVNNPPGY
jgi:hypothetical protein